LIAALAQRSKTTELATTAGQFIHYLGGRDELSPIGAIQDIVKSRTTAFKGDLEAAKTQVIKSAQDAIEQAASPAPIWDKFINSILCEE